MIRSHEQDRTRERVRRLEIARLRDSVRTPKPKWPPEPPADAAQPTETADEITVVGSVASPAASEDTTSALSIVYLSDVTGATSTVFPYLVVKDKNGKTRKFRLQEDTSEEESQ